MGKVANDIEGVTDGSRSSGNINPDETTYEDRSRGGAGLRTKLLARAAGAGCALSSDYCVCACSQMAKLALFGNPNSKTTRELLTLELGKKREERATGEGSSVFTSTLTQALAVSATDSSINLSGSTSRRV